MKRYVIVVNNWLFEGGRVFTSVDELKQVFKDWAEGEDMVTDTGDVVTVEDLIEFDEPVIITNKAMWEMGSVDSIIGICELQE